MTSEANRPGPGPVGAGPVREPAPVGWPGTSSGGYDATVRRPPAPAAPSSSVAAPSVQRPPSPPPARPVTVGSAPPRKGGRRARLTVRRIDPWSTLKFSFVYSLAGLVVLLVAVVALYAIVDAMGVLNSIRGFLHDIEGSKKGAGLVAWLSFGRVVTVALVVGIINVILFTAFATVTAFIYNVCTELVGGIEVTLAERS